MASALTVLLLGCWLAKQSGVLGEGSYPKPSISVSPGEMIPIGGNVTIRCRHHRLGMRFLLYKAGDGMYWNYTDPAGSEAEFNITRARREQSGNYTCRYSGRSGAVTYSEPSDPVRIIVAELSFPKPSIFLSPSGRVTLGGVATIQCRGQHQGLEFVLYKAGARNAAAQDGDSAEVKFPIPKVSRAHGGSYTCYYHPDSDPGRWSQPSEPVELVIADPGLPIPSISLSPTGVTAPRADITIRCEGPYWAVRFFLHKAGHVNPPRHTDPAGDGAEFHIPTVGRQHGGNYSCSYRPRSEPFVSSLPSPPVQLVVAEPSLPKPSISIHPSWEVAPRGAATIRCQARTQNATFLLYKDGGYWRHSDPAGDVAEFPVARARWEDAGSYSCSYHTTREPVAVSHSSNPAQLVVRDPKPNISLHPSGGIALGEAVTIQCDCRCRGARFLLSKVGDPDAWRLMSPTGDVSEFPIRRVCQRDAGNYSCLYSTKLDPPIWSEPSNPVELVITGGSDLKLSISTIAGMSAAAASLLLLLLLAFLYYRRARGRSLKLQPKSVNHA